MGMMMSADQSIQAAAIRTMFDSESFRQAMRHPANSVAVIATGEGDARTGLTATAVCSLSDSPPSLLVCVNQKSYALGTIRGTGIFSVNFLHPDQTDIAAIFAGRTELYGAERFQEGAWVTVTTGAPVLKRSLASFDCYVDQQIDYATHTILIGHVASATQSGERDALVYAHGEFFRASR